MQRINAFSLAPDVITWLAGSNRPRILHVFDHACNLINERKEILSIVMPKIGNGPFNLVIEKGILFSDHLSLQSQVRCVELVETSNSSDHLNLGGFAIHTTDAKLWSPRPDWERLHSQKDKILASLTQLPITNYLLHGGFDMPFNEHSGLLNHQYLPVIQSLLSNLSSTLATADITTAKSLASQLAGLGQGLTPAGDDFILGSILAVWIIHPPNIAQVLAKEISDTAAALTTSLSAAWLRSAGRGDAGVLWHDLFNALILPSSSLQSPISNLLATGETSGADALAGFFGVVSACKERIIDPCPS